MIIKGVGKLMARRIDPATGNPEVITCGTLQDLKITYNTDIGDIFGGDGLFAIDQMANGKSIEVTATDAKFDLDAVRLMMGSEITEKTNSYIWKLEEKKTIGQVNGTLEETVIEFAVTASGGVTTVSDTVTVSDGTNTFAVSISAGATPVDIAKAVALAVDGDADLNARYSGDTVTISTVATGVAANLVVSYASGTPEINDTTTRVDGTGVAIASAVTTDEIPYIHGAEFQVRLVDENKVLTQVSSSPTMYQYTANEVTGVLTFNGALNGKAVSINYKISHEVDLVDLLTDEVPFPVSVIHHGSFKQKNGKFGGIETELYACIANGQFSYDGTRAQASSSSISLKIIDPERPDGKIGTIKRYESDTKL